MCGQLFCQHGTFQNTVNSVYILEVGVYVPSTRRIEQCIAFTTPSNSDVMSPGLVEDGMKCGSGKMCYEQRCRDISSLTIRQCPVGSNRRVCSGNGVCTNSGVCSCNSGYSGNTCSSSSGTHTLKLGEPNTNIKRKPTLFCKHSRVPSWECGNDFSMIFHCSQRVFEQQRRMCSHMCGHKQLLPL